MEHWQVVLHPGPGTAHGMSRCCGSGNRQVTYQTSNRHIDIMTNTTDSGDRRSKYSTGDALIIEGLQTFQTSPATNQNNHINILFTQSIDSSHNVPHCFWPLDSCVIKINDKSPLLEILLKIMNNYPTLRTNHPDPFDKFRQGTLACK